MDSIKSMSKSSNSSEVSLKTNSIKKKNALRMLTHKEPIQNKIGEVPDNSNIHNVINRYTHPMQKSNYKSYSNNLNGILSNRTSVDSSIMSQYNNPSIARLNNDNLNSYYNYNNNSNIINSNNNFYINNNYQANNYKSDYSASYLHHNDLSKKKVEVARSFSIANNLFGHHNKNNRSNGSKQQLSHRTPINDEGVNRSLRKLIQSECQMMDSPYNFANSYFYSKNQTSTIRENNNQGYQLQPCVKNNGHTAKNLYNNNYDYYYCRED